MTIDGKKDVPIEEAMKEMTQAVANVLIKMGVDSMQLQSKVGKMAQISKTSTTVPIDFKIIKK